VRAHRLEAGATNCVKKEDAAGVIFPGAKPGLTNPDFFYMNYYRPLSLMVWRG
jgi:hypothetical protein